MIFLEIISPTYPFAGAKQHYVGSSLDDILSDINQEHGLKDWYGEYSYKQISAVEAQELHLRYLNEGIESVFNGHSASFILGE